MQQLPVVPVSQPRLDSKSMLSRLLHAASEYILVCLFINLSFHNCIHLLRAREQRFLPFPYCGILEGLLMFLRGSPQRLFYTYSSY